MKALSKLTLAAFLTLTPALLAEPEISREAPSPNGRYEIRVTRDADSRTEELVRKDTDQVLCQIVGSGDDDGFQRMRTEVVWSADSQRFAVGVSENKRASHVVIYERAGEVFKPVQLPKVPEVVIPAKYSNPERYWHTTEIDFWTPIRWQKDGSLLMEGMSGKDGNGNYVEAKRRDILRRDKSGKWTLTSGKTSAEASSAK